MSKLLLATSCIRGIENLLPLLTAKYKDVTAKQFEDALKESVSEFNKTEKVTTVQVKRTVIAVEYFVLANVQGVRVRHAAGEVMYLHFSPDKKVRNRE